MNVETIGVIIPVHNGEAYIAEALRSVAAQTRPADEIIVIDDGSTDGTPDVVAAFGGRVSCVCQARVGVSAARNRGIALSAASLLSFLDADDTIEPRKIEVQAAAFAADPDLDFCDGTALNFWSPEIPRDRIERDERFSADVLQPYVGHISTWMMRRSLIDRVGLFNEALAYAEDVDLMLRVRDSGAVMRRLPGLLSRRRLHLANVSRLRRSAHDANLAWAIKQSLDRSRGRRRKEP